MRQVFWTITIAFMLQGAFAHTLESEQSNGKFHMKLKVNSQDLVLNISIENLSDQTMAIPRGFLPWERYTAMTLAIVETDALHTPLEPLLEVQDRPLGKDHKLAPQKRLSGRVSLVDLFPSLLESRKHRDLILFWNYNLPETTERVGGWLLIPKQNDNRKP